MPVCLVIAIPVSLQDEVEHLPRPSNPNTELPPVWGWEDHPSIHPSIHPSSKVCIEFSEDSSFIGATDEEEVCRVRDGCRWEERVEVKIFREVRITVTMHTSHMLKHAEAL